MTEPHTKSITLRTKAAGAAPSEQDLAKIHAYALREFKPEELYMRTVLVAHNGIDRDDECFDESVLAKIATQLPGKGVFEIHPLSHDGDKGLPEGLWFDAYVERKSFDDARAELRAPTLQFPPDRTEAVLVYAKFYMPVTTANEELRTKIDAGINFASVGVLMPQFSAVKDADGRELTARRIVDIGETTEASFVWLGAQQGARAIKSTQRGNPMDTKTLEKQVSDLTAERDQARTKALRLDEIETALGADKALLGNTESLKALVADGRAYRDHLVDATIKAQRATKSIKADSDEQVADLRKAYQALPTAVLKNMHDASVEALPKGGTIPASNPNAANAGDSAKKPEGEEGVLQNARDLAAKAVAYVNEQKAKGVDVSIDQAVARLKSA